MKIFVTVGTTAFDDLIKVIDTDISLEKINVLMQISTDANYIPSSKDFFPFTNDIHKYYDWADIIITHAGAGSIYRLLELGKKIIVVPNISRVDSHQLDISEYVENNNLGIVCYDIEKIKEAIEKAYDFEADTYTKENFSMEQEIINYLLD